jgi:hypothetical protein
VVRALSILVVHDELVVEGDVKKVEVWLKKAMIRGWLRC